MRKLCLVVLSLFLASSLFAATDAELAAAGKTAFRNADFEKAISLFEKAIAQKPNVAEYHYLLGGAYGRKAQSASLFGAAGLAKKAKASLERAVQLDPNFIDARLALVDFYIIAPGIVGGSEEKAKEQANEIKKRDLMAGHRAWAAIYARQKKLDLARKEYVDAVRAQPNSGKAHYFLGRFLMEEKNFTGAWQELETALKLEPKWMPTYLRIGQVAAHSGTNFSRGEEALRKYLAYTPAENEPGHATAWYSLGIIQEKQGKKAEARQSYLNAQKLAPGVKDITEALKRVS